MRNLWLLISKYNAFVFFIIFFIASLYLVVSNNSFQRSGVLNTSNRFIGQAYQQLDEFRSYLRLAKINDSLAAENARLRSLQAGSFFDDSVVQQTITDTLKRQQYTYTVARIVNNSVHQKENFITINRGKRHGIARGMGVICATGIVGIVRDVSEDFATVTSLLNTDIKISASISESNAFGSLVWGEGIYNPELMLLQDIPNHIIVKKGQHVVTSGYSTLFPAGLIIGKVIGTRSKNGESFPDVVVKLHTDFSTMQYVYVIKNAFAAEKEQLELLRKHE